MGGSQGNKLNKKFIKLDLIFGCFFFFFFFIALLLHTKYYVCILYVKWRLFDIFSMTVQIHVEVFVSCLDLSISIQRFFFFSNEHMFVCNVMYSLYVLFYSIYLTLSIFILRGLHVYWIINWCENKITIIDCWHNILNFNN